MPLHHIGYPAIREFGERILVRKFLDRLSHGKPEQAAEYLQQLVDIPGWLDYAFSRDVVKPAERDAGVFLRALLAIPGATFGRFSLLLKAFELGERTLSVQLVQQRIASLEKEGALPVVRFSGADLLTTLQARSLGNESFREVARLKYGNSEGLGDTSKFCDQLEARIDLPRGLIEQLHRHTRYQDLTREEWEKRLRLAFCWDHILIDEVALAKRFGRANETPAWQVDFKHDMEPAKKILGAPKQQGSLFVFFHGGFTRLVARTFRLSAADGVVVGGLKHSSNAPNSIAIDDPRRSLFQMFQAIRNGRSVLIAPDGNQAKSHWQMRVLGEKVRVAQGALFIAYETGCQTFWIHMRRSGDLFTPEIMEGPVSRQGEKFESFKERWLTFYGNRISDFLAGDPGDLALKPPWMRRFSTEAKGAGHADRPSLGGPLGISV